MIVDSSAIIAILLGESDGESLLERLALGESPQISAFTYLETGTVLLARRGPAGKRALDALIDAGGITVTPFDHDQATRALDAIARFGKGRHQAALNLGDSVSYALSKATGKPLLFKGEDFMRTDLVPA